SSSVRVHRQHPIIGLSYGQITIIIFINDTSSSTANSPCGATHNTARQPGPRLREHDRDRYGCVMSRPTRTRRQATLASLAAALGASRTTGCNAYDRPDQLSPELRKRAPGTAERLGYPGPDPVARSLRTRKAGALGLLLTENLSYAFRDPAAVGVLEGIALACEDQGIGLHLVPASPGNEDLAAVHRAGVDGFVVYSVPDDDPHLEAVLARQVPTVIVDQPRIDGISRVGPDDEAATKMLAKHL